MPVINCTQCHDTCFINDTDIDKINGFVWRKCPPPLPVIVDDCLCDECDFQMANENKKGNLLCV